MTTQAFNASFRLRPLPLLIAGLFATATSFAVAAGNEEAVADPVTTATGSNDQPISTVEVTSAHLKSARIDLSPKIGTTVYAIDHHMVDALSQGDFPHTVLHGQYAGLELLTFSFMRLLGSTLRNSARLDCEGQVWITAAVCLHHFFVTRQGRSYSELLLGVVDVNEAETFCGFD